MRHSQAHPFRLTLTWDGARHSTCLGRRQISQRSAGHAPSASPSAPAPAASAPPDPPAAAPSPPPPLDELPPRLPPPFFPFLRCLGLTPDAPFLNLVASGSAWAPHMAHKVSHGGGAAKNASRVSRARAGVLPWITARSRSWRDRGEEGSANQDANRSRRQQDSQTSDCRRLPSGSGQGSKYVRCTTGGMGGTGQSGRLSGCDAIECAMNDDGTLWRSTEHQTLR